MVGVKPWKLQLGCTEPSADAEVEPDVQPTPELPLRGRDVRDRRRDGVADERDRKGGLGPGHADRAHERREERRGHGEDDSETHPATVPSER